jgi:hypothetical protein
MMTNGKYNGKKLHITYSYENDLFTLVAEDGTVDPVEGEDSEVMARKAFAEGAQSVSHDYNLILHKSS